MPDNDTLRDKPMDFMRRFAVSPAGAGYGVVPNPNAHVVGQLPNIMAPVQTLTPKQTLWSDVGGTSMPDITPNVGTMRVAKGGVVWVNVIDVPRDKPGAKTFQVSASAQGGWVPIHFLPWDGMGTLVEMYLPETGRNLDDRGNPNIFFTTALSGCSVFVDNGPTHPRIVHAGIDGKLKVDAAEFWRARLVDLGRRNNGPLAVQSLLQEVNKHQYGDDSTWIRSYKLWLQDEKNPSMTITEVAGWACVFGIRFGRLWSFYLQRNATVSVTTLVKKSEVDTSTKDKLVLKTGGAAVTSTTQGKGFSKKTLYSTTAEMARPVVIESFYPQGKAVIRIKNEYSAI